jgi:hypothetical protein
MAGPTDRPGGEPESLAEVLASIRQLVSAETESRLGGDGASVLMLTPAMRVDAAAARVPAGETLAEGLSDRASAGAPILDEQSLRDLINSIVREELQGELGEQIGRNLRKLVRREIHLILEEQRKS